MKKFSVILTILSSIVTITIFLGIRNIQDILNKNTYTDIDLHLYEKYELFESEKSATIEGYIRTKENTKSVNTILNNSNLRFLDYTNGITKTANG